MTAVAKLPEKWREEAKFDASTPEESGYKAALLDCIDELTAALSPAELGGVEGPLRVFSEGAWVYEETGQRFSARDLDEAAFAEYLRHPLSTPRAAEAEWLPIESAPKDGQTVLVGRDVGEPWGFVRGYAHYYGGGGGFVQGWISRGFTNPPGELGLAHPTHWRPLPAPPALTPPSAKGE